MWNILKCDFGNGQSNQEENPLLSGTRSWPWNYREDKTAAHFWVNVYCLYFLQSFQEKSTEDLNVLLEKEADVLSFNNLKVKLGKVEEK